MCLYCTHGQSQSSHNDPLIRCQVVQVRLCYLSNERLVWLQQQSPSSIPSDLLLQGTMQRLQFQDQSNALSEAPVQPRSSYCSNLQYGLPGGQEHVDVPVHHIWDLLAGKIRVKVSGMTSSASPSNPEQMLVSCPGFKEDMQHKGEVQSVLTSTVKVCAKNTSVQQRLSLISC